MAASLTPLAEDGSVDIGRMKHHFDWLFAQGCSFVSPFGSTGEGPSFSVAEKHAALTALKLAGVDMGRVIPAAMSAAVDDTVTSIRTALTLGCRAILIVPPYYYGSASQAGIADFFAACAAPFGGNFPLDVVLYHIPAMSKIGFDPELVADLVARFPNRIAGIKDSTGDRDHALMLARTFPNLRIFTGDDRVLPHLLAAGGAGMIGGLPNVVAPDLCAFFADPTGPRAQTIMDQAALRIAAVDDYGGISALRALKAESYDDAAWAQPKAPLRALDGDSYARLRAAFVGSGFQF
ncbi:dihydrodipicolinate synthase family protein [Devosia yakushimensis]|uniref:Dihydrodipicolinate synthase family protein n=1 Tax=Devosia yakushimensis TaxID=470028 RepID=A0ABQ5UK69_9HYPH|nr:dihydrodipicolinate synthase family protein [Devosia yakushimensis]GLQ11583.1 dihydrodipicolinate synthase family protein [Devosia yakushimensis]